MTLDEIASSYIREYRTLARAKCAVSRRNQHYPMLSGEPPFACGPMESDMSISIVSPNCCWNRPKADCKESLENLRMQRTSQSCITWWKAK